jgi:hypothetical protein
MQNGYLRNIDGPELWRLRRWIALANQEVDLLEARPERQLARCALLRTAQWALDMRDELPSIGRFRDSFCDSLVAMVGAARTYSRAVGRIDRLVETPHRRRTLVITGNAVDLSRNPRIKQYSAPRLVLTSPPYPGVYVNYHRWKVHGRKETPAPYWIARQLDGKGLAYYTMHARAQKSLDSYFAQLRSAFEAVAAVCDENTTVVQVVGFSDPAAQFGRYLDAIRAAGFREVIDRKCATADDGRLWRDIPGRRWWTKANGDTTGEEVVLFHRLRRRS